jgi:predicted nucleic acid-binding Zn ribbon protein
LGLPFERDFFGGHLPRLSELIKQYLGEEAIEHARKQRGVFDSWQEIIEAAFEKREKAELCAGHTRIFSIIDGTLTVKADHTGWIQILQVQKDGILSAINQKFPEAAVKEIEFRLNK